MDVFSLLLALISGVAFWVLAIGLIKPSWLRVGSRKQVLKWMGIALVGGVVAILIKPEPTSTTNQLQAASSVAPTIEAQSPSSEVAQQESVDELVLSDKSKSAEEKSSERDKHIAELEDKARKKDYQAQRNLAYMLSGGQMVGDALNVPDDQKIRACAWRYVIVESGDKQVNASDQMNFATDCEKLSDTQKDQAAVEASKILEKVYGR